MWLDLSKIINNKGKILIYLKNYYDMLEDKLDKLKFHLLTDAF
jgi:hypothetical protein